MPKIVFKLELDDIELQSHNVYDNSSDKTHNMSLVLL